MEKFIHLLIIVHQTQVFMWSSITMPRQPALSHRPLLPLSAFSVSQYVGEQPVPRRGFLKGALSFGSIPGGFCPVLLLVLGTQCRRYRSQGVVWEGMQGSLTVRLRASRPFYMTSSPSSSVTRSLQRYHGVHASFLSRSASGLPSIFLPAHQKLHAFGIWKHHGLKNFFICLYFFNNTVLSPSSFLINLRQMHHFLPENSNDRNQQG